MGRKVHIPHPRVPSKDGHEIVLEAYIWAQNEEGLIEAEMHRVQRRIHSAGCFHP